MVRNIQIEWLTHGQLKKKKKKQIVPVMPTALSDRAGVPYEDRTIFFQKDTRNNNGG